MAENLVTGDIVEGKVVKIKSFGAIVSLSNNSHGLVHISHISTEFVQDINDYLSLGEVIKCKIISIDNEKRKISLSIKELEDKSSAEKTPVKKEFTEIKAREIKPTPQRTPAYAASGRSNSSPANFEDRMKDFLKSSNDRLSIINKRNKKR